MSAVEYEELAYALFNSQCELSPSGVHGLLTAGLILGTATTAPVWISQWVPEDARTTALVSLLTTLFTETQQVLFEDSDQFQFFLPSEDMLLTERGMALRDWCEGFLSYLIPNAGEHIEESGYEEVLEGLAHMSALAELEAAIEEDDENKELLDNLIEYVQSVVIAVHEIFAEKSEQIH